MKKKDKTNDEKPATPATPPAPDSAEQVGRGVPPSLDEPTPTPTPTPTPAPAPVSADDLARLQDQYLRMRADFDNYKKRVARDLSETIKSANKDLIESLLPAFDHFNSAEILMETKGAEAAPYLEGFRMVKNELLRTLESHGLKPVPATPGTPFDPNFHEAISTQPATETSPPNTILFEARKGYTLHGRILRPSHVVVAAEKVES